MSCSCEVCPPTRECYNDKDCVFLVDAPPDDCSGTRRTFQQEHQEGVSNWTTSDTCKGRDSSGSSPAADASQITADTHQIWTSRLSQVNELSHQSKRGKCWSACGDLVVVLCLPKGPKGSNLRHERRSLPCTCIQPSSKLIIIESKSKHHRSRPNSHIAVTIAAVLIIRAKGSSETSRTKDSGVLELLQALAGCLLLAFV